MSDFVWMGLGNLALAIPLAALAWMSGRFLRRPAFTHGLWALVLLKLVTPPMGALPIDLGVGHDESTPIIVDHVARLPEGPAIGDAVVPQEVIVEPLADNGSPSGGDLGQASVAGAGDNLPVEPAAAIAQPAPLPANPAIEDAADSGAALSWSMIAIGVLWLGGAAVTWLRVAWKAWRFERLLRSVPRVGGAIQQRVARFAEEFGVRCPEIAYVPGTLSPLIWVWGRRGTLVLPAAFFESLDADKQNTLIVHELAHWRRGDHWIRRLECLAGGLYWWCPLVLWAQQGLRQAEEELCDAWVVAVIPDSARVYALALVETVDFLAGARPMLPPLASGLGPFPSLQRRLTMIFRTGTPRRLTGWGLFGLVLLGGLFLSWSPAPMTAIAQEEPPRGKDKDRDPEKKEFKREGKRERGREGEKPPAPPREEPRPPKVDGDDFRPEDLERLRQELRARQEQLRARQAELEVMQAQLQRKTMELENLMKKARDARPVPPLLPGLPGEGRGPGGPGRPGGPDVDQRIDNLEMKLEMIIRELTKLRREVVDGLGQGPGGPPPRPNDNDLLPPPKKDGRGRPGFNIEIEVAPPPAPTIPAPPGGVRRSSGIAPGGAVPVVPGPVDDRYRG